MPPTSITVPVQLSGRIVKALGIVRDACAAAGALATAAGTAGSTTVLQVYAEQLDRHLGRLDRLLEESTAEPAEKPEAPTLFGQQVGDGLDQEREDARMAVAVLTRMLRAQRADFDGPGPGGAESVAVVRHSRADENKRYLSMEGRIYLIPGEADLLDRLGG